MHTLHAEWNKSSAHLCSVWIYHLAGFAVSKVWSKSYHCKICMYSYNSETVLNDLLFLQYFIIMSLFLAHIEWSSGYTHCCTVRAARCYPPVGQEVPCWSQCSYNCMSTIIKAAFSAMKLINVCTVFREEMAQFMLLHTMDTVISSSVLLKSME